MSAAQAQLFEPVTHEQVDREMARIYPQFARKPSGQQLKRQGQARAAGKHSEALKTAQDIALVLGKRLSTITIEDVRLAYERFNGGPWDLANAAGMVFDPKVWECVGRVNAQRPEAHHREIKVWRLR